MTNNVPAQTHRILDNEFKWKKPYSIHWTNPLPVAMGDDGAPLEPTKQVELVSAWRRAKAADDLQAMNATVREVGKWIDRLERNKRVLQRVPILRESVERLNAQAEAELALLIERATK